MEASVTRGVDPYARCWPCLGVRVVVVLVALTALDAYVRCCWVRVKPCLGVGLAVVLVTLKVLVRVVRALVVPWLRQL